ncbi:hypothetical protein [Spiroplasma endosymbiont of Notiophilus biguttatus]|uniref:hypothetical protein n=1 Tax=Spiroplasma endosymbiont of Notiophilus biguttatus TaxID=3066285 RepID=UPI00313CDFC5
MSDFTFDEKENYSLDDVKSLLKQHRNVVYAESKKDIEPKLSEYETKIKEYENKINSFEEQQLFSNIKDTKKVNLIKNLMSTDNYKSLSKQEAFNKINEDYKEFLIDKKSEPIKQENKQQDNSINPTDLILQLHNNSLDHFKIAQDLKNKATTQGMTNQKELEDLVEITRNEAFQSISK